MAYYNGKKVISLIHFDGRTAKKTYSESVKKLLDDLTNTKWLFKETLSNKTPNGQTLEKEPTQTITAEIYRINFSSNNQENTYIRLQSVIINNIMVNILKYSNGSLFSYSWKTELWVNQNYRTITITGGEDATNAKLINWLLQNATQIFD